MQPPCYVCPQFPVGGCNWPIENGATCEAQTIQHECVEQGTLTFECPDALAGGGAGVSWAENLTLGAHWGPRAYFSTWSGMLGVDHNNNTKRNADLVNVSGGFDVKCRVCGLANSLPLDADGREGEIDVTVEFGPNILDGVVNETGIDGYAIHFVSGCHELLSSELAFVNVSSNGLEGLAVESICGCPVATYSVRIAAAFPADGAGDVHLMIAPVLSTGYRLPIGAVSGALADYLTTTTTTSATATADANETSTRTATRSTTNTSSITTTRSTTQSATGTSPTTTSTTSATTTTHSSVTTTSTTTSNTTNTYTATMTVTTTSITITTIPGTSTTITNTSMALTATTATATSTTSLTRTTTQTSTATATVTSTDVVVPGTQTLISGRMYMDCGCANSSQFVNDPQVQAACTHSIANFTGVPVSFVEVTVGDANRSSGAARRLQWAGLYADFLIAVPSAETAVSAQSVAATLSSPDAVANLQSFLVTELASRPTSGTYAVTVISLTTPTITVATLTSTASTSSTTTTTQAPREDPGGEEDDGRGAMAILIAIVAVVSCLCAIYGVIMWYFFCKKHGQGRGKAPPEPPGDTAAPEPPAADADTDAGAAADDGWPRESERSPTPPLERATLPDGPAEAPRPPQPPPQPTPSVAPPLPAPGDSPVPSCSNSSNGKDTASTSGGSFDPDEARLTDLEEQSISQAFQGINRDHLGSWLFGPTAARGRAQRGRDSSFAI